MTSFKIFMIFETLKFLNFIFDTNIIIVIIIIIVMFFFVLLINSCQLIAGSCRIQINK